MTRRRLCAGLFSLGLMAAPELLAQPGGLVAVTEKAVSRTVELPGEIQPFQSVSVRARVPGFVERVLVDRGSFVKQGQLLIELSAPELKAEIAEAESKVQGAESERLQAAAELAGVESTYDRLKKASATPGAIAGNELVRAEKQVEAARAVVRAREQASKAAEAARRARQEIASYLRITAPFDGVVTERLVHPGALAGTGDAALLTIQQVSRLRLVVAVPEENAGAISRGAKVEFRVPAYPERTFAGTVARTAHAVDAKTRTMAVELDAANRDGSLAPGMYTTVTWPVRTARRALLVPKTSVVTTSERTFVVRARETRAEWVDVRKGPAEGDLVQVSGDLKPGDMVVRRATDEMRPGSRLEAAK